MQPGIVYDGLHKGYADLVYYKKKTPIEYVINSMLLTRKDNGNLPSNEVINSTLKEIEGQKAHKLITSELDTIGLSHKHNGREYIFQAIWLMLEKKPKAPGDFAPLPYLAKAYSSNTSNVTKAVKVAISYAWLNTPIETLEEHYTAPMQMNDGMPTPMELIYFYYKKIITQI